MFRKNKISHRIIKDKVVKSDFTTKWNVLQILLSAIYYYIIRLSANIARSDVR